MKRYAALVFAITLFALGQQLTAQNPPREVSPAEKLIQEAVAVGLQPWCGLNMFSVPVTYDPKFGLSEADWVLARNRPICAPPAPPMMNYGYGAYVGQPYPVGMAYGAMMPYGYPFYQPMFREGGIKTEGDVRGTDLWINGCYAGKAGAFDSPWNQKLAAHAGAFLVITVRRIKDNQSYETPTRVTSEWLNRYVGARHLPFAVNKEDLDRGQAFNRDEAKLACEHSPI